MTLTAIAAMSSNRVIGAGGGIPWHLPEDLRFFKGKTLGHTVLMGRKTWQSLPNGVLKHRRNIVLSRYLLDVPSGELARGLKELERLIKDDRAFVIGGSEIYRLLMPWTDEILLTVLEEDVQGDTFFPDFEEEFGQPEVLNRVEGVAEWRRYSRILKSESLHPEQNTITQH